MAVRSLGSRCSIVSGRGGPQLDRTANHYGPVFSGCPRVSVPESSPPNKAIFIYDFSVRFQRRLEGQFKAQHLLAAILSGQMTTPGRCTRHVSTCAYAKHILKAACFVFGGPFVGYECFYSSHVRRGFGPSLQEAPNLCLPNA